MKRSTITTLAAVLAGLAGLLSSPAASAASSWNGSWSYSSCSQAAANANGWGNSYNCTDTTAPADATLNLSAWSADLNPVANFTSSSVVDYGSSNGYGLVSREECNFAATVCNPGTGPHAADNWGNLDGFLLKYSSTTAGATASVMLNSITIGWNGTDNASTTGGVTYNDSDISVYYYTGSSAPDMTSVNNTNLASGGWTLLGNYSDVGAQSGNTISLGNTTKTSSWWLVTASNSNLGTTSSSDAFKLLGVAGTGTTTTKVAEPGSLALAGLALFGAVYTRRRKVREAPQA